jgi:transcriptional regulator with XRE-family HTH domain
MDTFGERLRRLRIRKGLSATEFAAAMKVSVTAVCNWENDGARPKPNRMASIAKTLGVDPHYLLGGAVSETFSEEIDRLRGEIAALAGVSKKQVRITLEL